LNTLDLDALDKLTRKAQKLQAIAADIMPLIKALCELGDKAILPLPADRLIRASEAAQILGVGKATIGDFVKAGLLTPYFVNSEQRRFWLSEVKSLPRKKPWTLGGKAND